MLDANLKSQLQGYLERLVHPVQIVASVDESDTSRDMLELLDGIVSLSPLVTLDPVRDAAQIKPSFALRRANEAPRVRFAGLPLGHEFTSLVLALLQTGGHPPKADPDLKERIRGLAGEWQFETFVSLSCQSCPDVVQALNLMAVLNPAIRHTMLDGALFQTEVAGREVMAVPAVFLNGQPFAQGRMELEEIVAKLTGTAAGGAQQINARAPYDMLVVRGRTGGGGRGDLRGPQGNSHRHRGRAHGGSAARYGGHRKLHFRDGNRRP